MQRPWRRYCLQAALAGFPLAYGTVHPLPVFLFELGAFVLFAWWALETRKTEQSWRHLRDPLLILGAMALLLGGAQLLPLPLPLLEFLSPGTYDLVNLPGATGLPAPAWHSIAVVPWAAEQAWLWLAALVGWYAVLQAEAQTRRGTAAVVRTLAGTAAALACLGMLQKMTGADAIYWSGLVRPQFYATFVNPNNAAGALTIGTMACVAAAGITPHRKSRPLWYAAALLCATSAVFSLSRAGIGVLVFALLFTGYAARRAGADAAATRSMRVVPLALIVATTLFIGWIGTTELLGEFQKVKDEGGTLNGRTDVWRIALVHLFPDFAWFGAGFGNFPEVFPVYQTGAVRYHAQAAENEYVQVLAEAGLAGAILLGGALAEVVRRVRKTLASAKRLSVGIPFAAALLALMLHMLVDFPMHVGGSALWILTCLALVSRQPAATGPAAATPTVTAGG